MDRKRIVSYALPEEEKGTDPVDQGIIEKVGASVSNGMEINDRY